MVFFSCLVFKTGSYNPERRLNCPRTTKSSGDSRDEHKVFALQELERAVFVYLNFIYDSCR